MKRLFLVGLMLGIFLSCGYAQQKKTEHVFKGKVEKIDLANKSFVVKGEEVKGWMGAMTMSYGADKEDILKKLKVGDEITAKVYDGDFRTLHEVQIVPPKADAKSAPAKK